MTEVMTDSALRDRIISIFEADPVMMKSIRSLRTTSKFIINVTDNRFIDLFNSCKESFASEVKTAILQLLKDVHPGLEMESTFNKLSIELRSEDVIELHDISPEYENTPIRFKCDVIASDSRKTYVKKAVGHCPKCKSEYKFRLDFDKTMPKIYCSERMCKFSQVVMDKSTMVTGYVQTLVIQEPLEEAVFSTPVIFIAKIYDDNVGMAFPGQKKEVTAIFHSIMGKDENDIVLEITNMEDLEDIEPILPTQDEIKKYTEAVKNNDDFCDKLVESFAPQIYTDSLLKNVKLSILLQLVGGSKFERRSDINQLLVGDPSMAKSELLKHAKKITQKSIYTSGKGATAAGLTIGMVKLDNGRSVALPGVMPLCSGGYAFIDEFDKMSPNDRSAMHEAMEQQTVSISKAGVSMTLPAKTSVLAAANPIAGNYDRDISLADNINLPTPILSRFDMIWLITDSIDEFSDTRKAKYILNAFTPKTTLSEPYMTDRSLMAYLNYVRKLNPIIPPNVNESIILFYNRLRQAANKNSGLAIGTRQLEALVRMITAHAKLMMKQHVDLEDLNVVTELIKASYMSMNVNLEKGDSPMNELINDNDSKEVVIIKTWSLCKDKDGLVTRENFISSLEQTRRFSEFEAMKVFENMYKEGKIFEKKSNLYKKST